MWDIIKVDGSIAVHGIPSLKSAIELINKLSIADKAEGRYSPTAYGVRCDLLQHLTSRWMTNVIHLFLSSNLYKYFFLSNFTYKYIIYIEKEDTINGL